MATRPTSPGIGWKKTVQCAGGVQQDLAFGLRIKNDTSHIDWTWYNCNNTSFSDIDGIQAGAGNSFFQEINIYLDGTFEMWSHDTDPDSFVLILRNGANLSVLGWWPPGWQHLPLRPVHF